MQARLGRDPIHYDILYIISKPGNLTVPGMKKA